MAKKKLDDKGNIVNQTQTNLQILKSIEKAYFNNNPNVQKRNTLKSLKWFQRYVPKAHNNVRTPLMLRDRDMWSDRLEVGKMYLAQYDAVHKDILPVWDAFPLLLPWDSWRGNNGKQYIISINLHYLPPALRYTAMKALLSVKNEKRYRKSTRLKHNWDILKGMAQSKLFEHCVKMYRVENFKTKFIEIPPASWEMVVFLPIARWQNADQSLAWQIGKKKTG